MILTALFFYLFAGVCVASAFMVIAAKNPVHSVLYLILAFVNAAGLFVLLGAEFLGDDPDRGLRRRGRGAVPVRRHDARRGFRRAAAGLPQLPAGRARSSGWWCWSSCCWWSAAGSSALAPRRRSGSRSRRSTRSPTPRRSVACSIRNMSITSRLRESCCSSRWSARSCSRCATRSASSGRTWRRRCVGPRTRRWKS